MNCPDYVEWISDLLDGTLPAERALELDRHLAECPRCRAELALQRNLRETLSTLPDLETAELPKDFAEQVSARAHASGHLERWVSRIPDLVPLLAFAAGITLVVVFRSDLVRILPAWTQSVTNALAAPVSFVHDSVMRLLAGAADLPEGRLPAVEQISRPFVMMLIGTVLAAVPAVWAVSHVFSFLRD